MYWIINKLKNNRIDVVTVTLERGSFNNDRFYVYNEHGDRYSFDPSTWRINLFNLEMFTDLMVGSMPVSKGSDDPDLPW